MRIDQRMKLAPRMIQSMEILQMPTAALEERLEQELASNPTLEIQEPGSDRAALEAEQEQTDRDNREGERELVVEPSDGSANHADDFERLSNLSEEYADSWDAGRFETGEAYRPRAAQSDGERDGKLDALANTAARSTSLYEQLMDQWRLVDAPPNVLAAGEFLIGFIDADGYLRSDNEELVKQAPPGMTLEHLDAARALMLQSLDPPGLAARDIRECWLLQIDARLRQNPDEDLELTRRIVADHLPDVEANRLPRIAKALDVPVDRVKQAIAELKHFHAHPGRLLADESPRIIRPDAVVEYDEDEDRYVARLTDGRLPAVQISPAYSRMVKDRSVDKKTRDFVGQNLNSARWLIDAIQQRNATLLRVINVVLDAQREYFDQGPQALRPLPMTLVADQLGIHVATVSRAVNEKYLQTPRGIVPLRMFFSGGTETESGDAMSWTAVQAKLEQIIAEEDKSDPLSDDQLADKLKEQGIDIARRTVAKYRKQLNIPPARQRREY